ncbi:MAG: GAF domain-containing protein [Desulfatiglandaceae bacterium]|jgi:GAF domain-containing protein
MATKSDYFKTICKVSRAFGTTLDRDELLELIVQSAIDTMRGKAACLFLFDEEKDISVPVAQKGLSDGYFHAKWKSARDNVSDVMKEGYLAIHDATKDPRSENHEAKQEEGIASILAVPVKVKGKVIGVLTLYTARRRTFTENEIAFLAALAEQGGMAIENTRLIEQLRRNTTLFHNLSAGINSTLDIKEILNVLSADIARGLGVKGAAVRLLDEKRNTLKPVASYGLRKKFLKKGPISAEKSIAQALEGKPVVVRNAATDDRIQYKKEVKEEGIVSLLCVPIKAKDEVIGVLRIYSGSEHEFTEDDITFVSALAHQGGLAIQNAAMYLTLQQDMKDVKEDVYSYRSWF